MRPFLATASLALVALSVAAALPGGAWAAPPRCEIVACPDLVVSRVVPAKDGFYATVKNVGARQADALSWLGAARGSGDPKLYMVPGLAPGDTHRVKVTTPCAPRTVWTFRADWTDAVAEENEGNNGRTQTC